MRRQAQRRRSSRPVQKGAQSRHERCRSPVPFVGVSSAERRRTRSFGFPPQPAGCADEPLDIVEDRSACCTVRARLPPVTRSAPRSACRNEAPRHTHERGEARAPGPPRRSHERASARRSMRVSTEISPRRTDPRHAWALPPFTRTMSSSGKDAPSSFTSRSGSSGGAVDDRPRGRVDTRRSRSRDAGARSAIRLTGTCRPTSVVPSPPPAAVIRRHEGSSSSAEETNQPALGVRSLSSVDRAGDTSSTMTAGCDGSPEGRRQASARTGSHHVESSVGERSRLLVRKRPRSPRGSRVAAAASDLVTKASSERGSCQCRARNSTPPSATLGPEPSGYWARTVECHRSHCSASLALARRHDGSDLVK